MRYFFSQEMVESQRSLMLETLRTLFDYQLLIEFLLELGLDLEAIIEVLTIMFSWFPL
jgi:metal-sulfur cluster biosynthetic enzyme